MATVEAAYERSTFRLLVHRQLTEQEVASMVGHPLEASAPDGKVNLGIVASAELIESGKALRVTVENGGRACALCGQVFYDEHVHASMRPVREYRHYIDAGVDWAQDFAGLPDGALVCASYDECRARRESAAAAGKQLPGRRQR